MVKLSEIRALIDAYIKTNGNQEITGHTMNVLLNEIVRILDERKQDVLVSGENIKTIGGMSLLGKGDIPGYDDTEIRNLLNAVVAAVEGQNGKITEVAGSVQEQGKNLTEKEDKKNKVTSLSDESTDVQYPSAKIVYYLIKLLKERIEEQDQFIEDLQNTKIEKENDDYYPKMAVGLADNLAGVDVVDSQINFRRSGGGAISDGVARIESIKGNSVVWNEIFKAYATSVGTKVINGVTYTLTAEGDLTAEGTAEGSSAEFVVSAKNLIKAHKYLINAPSVESSWNTWALYFNGYTTKPNSSEVFGGWSIFQATATAVANMVLTCWADKTISVKTKVAIHDLTQMFGAGNEPTTIEEFYARIPMGVDLNAYNEGEVIHMDVQSIESQGANAWDEEWELGTISTANGTDRNDITTQIRSKFIPIKGGAAYYAASAGVTWGFFYDKDKKPISQNVTSTTTGIASEISCITFITPTNARYMRFYLLASYGTTYNHDICINLSDASINGKYFPYIKRVEDLSIIRKYFPQGMKSAGAAHDEIRYNKASGKWEYSKGRLKEVDMGSLNWTRRANGNLMLFDASIADIAPATTTALYTNNLLQVRYPFDTSGGTSLMIDKTIRRYGKSIYIRDDAYTDAASFKAAMQGVILYYEAAEWEWVELDEADQFKDLDYQVWNGGTEKANAEGKSAPLAADITYGFNAIGKIKELESLVAALRAKVGI